MSTIREDMRPISRERAVEILINGHDGYHTGCDGRKAYRQLLTDDELHATQRYFVQEAPGSWSFNDVIRECARPAP